MNTSLIGVALKGLAFACAVGVMGALSIGGFIYLRFFNDRSQSFRDNLRMMLGPGSPFRY